MVRKISCGVLGATGMVGQNYISLLENHPWFEISYVAASPQSAGKSYRESVSGRWHMQGEIPGRIGDLIVEDANDIDSAIGKCEFVFSCLEMKKDETTRLEEAYASKAIPVVSNASAHRLTEDVPMLIPEINYDHLSLIDIQRRNRGWNKGFIVVKPNCSLQSYLTPVYALISAGYDVSKLVLTTEQALSGAGHPGVASLDIIDNVVPYISGENEKTEKEPLKILGKLIDGKIVSYEGLKISAHCTRVNVYHGHLASVNLEFRDKKPLNLGEIIDIWAKFRSLPQVMDLPFAPKNPIIYREEIDRPQPRKDRNVDKGMAVVVGQLEKCPVMDIKFYGLSHNLIRGAAGGGILNAELLKSRGYLS